MWRFIHYATRGRSHIKNNIPCQDKTYVLQKHNASVIALADGAGSARLSHFGAKDSVLFVSKHIAKYFDEYASNNKTKEQLLAKIQKELMLKAMKYKCSLKDLACTLLCIAIKEDRFILFHIGDGVIGCLKNNVLEVLSAPDNGEFANTTNFVTSKNALESIRYISGSVNKISGFVLMSDGTQASLYSKKYGTLAPVIKDIIHSEFGIKKLQIGLQNSFENTIKNATSDDCSIAFAIKGKTCGYNIGSLSRYFSRIKNAKLLKKMR